MPVSVRAAPFDPYAELRARETAMFSAGGRFGATAIFVGTMRDTNAGDMVASMTLEHYPGMTEQHLADLCAAAHAKWPLLDSLVVHRVGEIKPGEPIVLVAVWSVHRAEAFEACRFIMEDLKSRAPFWKKEALASGERWVANNTPGTTNAQ